MPKWPDLARDRSEEGFLVIERGEAWRPTIGLRWLERAGDRALQQLWVSSGGAREWRDVPTEREEA